MKVIKPNQIAAAQLTSSTVPETEHAAYAAGTTYALADRVIYAHRICESLSAGNIGHTPDANPVYWSDVGPTNQWAMFDEQTSTITSADNTMTVVIATGMIDSIALINVSAYQADIVVRDGIAGPIIYSDTLYFSGDVATDWYQYFFYDPLSARAQGILKNMPPYTSASVTLTLTGGGVVSIGNFICGRLAEVGGALEGAVAGNMSFSRKDTDPTSGKTTFVRRANSKRISANLLIEKPQLNRVQRLLYGLDAIPCVWIGSEDEELEEAMVVYGFYRDFSTTIAYQTHALCALEIEGLI